MRGNRERNSQQCVTSLLVWLLVVMRLGSCTFTTPVHHQVARSADGQNAPQRPANLDQQRLQPKKEAEGPQYNFTGRQPSTSLTSLTLSLKFWDFGLQYVLKARRVCVCVRLHACTQRKGSQHQWFSVPLTHIIRMQSEYIKLKWKWHQVINMINNTSLQPEKQVLWQTKSSVALN